jgi:HD-like signal output (HDOD) protein
VLAEKTEKVDPDLANTGGLLCDLGKLVLAHLHAAKYLATTLGPGVVEDGFLFALHGSFLTEWGFTPDLLEASMPILLDRASARLRQKLTHGAVEMG